MKRKVGNVFYHVFIITFALLMLYPLLWMISASFKDTLEIFQGTHFLPETFKMDNYSQGWQGLSGVTFGRIFYEFFSYCYCSHDWESVFLSAGGKCVCQNQVSAEGILVCTYDGNADASHACKADSTVYYVQ